MKKAKVYKAIDNINKTIEIYQKDQEDFRIKGRVVDSRYRTAQISGLIIARQFLYQILEK